MDTVTNRRSARGTAGAVMIFLPGLALAFSSMLKFAGVPGVTGQMASMGFAGGKLILIAMLEILSAALFLWPRTRSIGLLMMSSYLGGAICAHVQGSDYAKALSPFIVLALTWLGTWLRHPQIRWSFNDDAGPANQFRERRGRNLASREA
jgi:hypothetical protein